MEAVEFAQGRKSSTCEEGELRSWLADTSQKVRVLSKPGEGKCHRAIVNSVPCQQATLERLQMLGLARLPLSFLTHHNGHTQLGLWLKVGSQKGASGMAWKSLFLKEAPQPAPLPQSPPPPPTPVPFPNLLDSDQKNRS